MLVVLAAAPFAARQTEHLTGGGFNVPGSGSETVDNSLDRFQGAQRESLGAVLRPARGASAADARALPSTASTPRPRGCPTSS